MIPHHSERLACPECAQEVHTEAICQHARAVCIGCCGFVCWDEAQAGAERDAMRGAA